MDPLATFQNTKRDIKLSFDVVSDSREQALTNLIRINKLISFLYPVYEESSRGVQNTLNAAPLIGLKWTNLINNAMGGEELIGYIDGINYAPDMGEGGFIIAETDKTFVPKKVSISFGFKVLHTHMVGWNGGSFGDSLYNKFPNVASGGDQLQQIAGSFDSESFTADEEGLFDSNEPATLFDQMFGALSGTE
tara:strand:- start:141 stop:716 length:576 start_codon:yes stop_codon:yes gene_type:complete